MFFILQTGVPYHGQIHTDRRETNREENGRHDASDITVAGIRITK